MPRSSAASSAPERGVAEAVAIVGATASGKTGVGILLAEALGTEVIGCDSRQVCRRLDIGTAKPTPAERSRVRHHLVDVVEPAEPFTAARYAELARALLTALRAAGRTPLFVGGTGLYLRAALEGLCGAPAGHPALRAWLRALGAQLPAGLHPLLARVDPAAASRIHPNDRFRIVRALEVFYLSGEPLSARQERHRAHARPLPARIFAIDLPAAELRRRIDARLAQMLADGFVDEVRRLLDEGLDPALPAMRAVGYPEIVRHLRGECTLGEAADAARRATWQYARRQLIWFRAVPGIVWVPAGPATTAAETAGAILERLREGVAA